MSYRMSNESTKIKNNSQKIDKGQVTWHEDPIPPLISINPIKQKSRIERASLVSLNQSEVQSIYTMDKQQIDKNNFQILNSSFKSHRVEKINRINTNNSTNPKQNKVQSFQTPLLKKQYDTSFKQQQKTPIVRLEAFNQIQYKNCSAVQLYKNLVQQKIDKRQSNFEDYEWFKNKSSAQLLASLLTNHTRLRIYIHYLLQQIHQNERSKLVNQIHQQQLRQYNPHLKQVYTSLICLLSKITNRGQKFSKNLQSGLQVSIFENGISIDLDPKLTRIKQSNNQKIRKLKYQASNFQSHLQQVKNLYSQIMQNYSISIQNLEKQTQDKNNLSLYAPLKDLKESRVHLQVEEQDQIQQIRKKNHTFGMKQASTRSSKQQ